ncbi:MAG TPA: SRPBCC family protein [Actinomycetes bacterium]|jgi:ribosome-associated toxin RatA of RatAB toxin-antitoxin module|nr:SRPBCC family protein [Actinomycetes bacterium]
MAERAEGSIVVAATPKEIMAVIAGFEAYPEWIGDMEEVEVLERDRRGRGSVVAFKVRSPLVSAAYTLAYQFAPRDRGMSWTYRGGTLRDLSGAYELEALDDATKVTYRMELELAMPMPGLVKRQAARQIVRSALNDLKRRVESG